jgi:hypothetical protein
MKIRSTPFALLALLTLSTGCGDDNGTEPPSEDLITVEDLVGSWTASSHTFTNNADPSQTFETIANGGETRVTVLSGGRARFWFELGTYSDEFDALLTISGNTITTTPVEASRPVIGPATFTFVGNVFTTTDLDSTFDFTLSEGPEVPATEVVVWQRQ